MDPKQSQFSRHFGWVVPVICSNKMLMIQLKSIESTRFEVHVSVLIRPKAKAIPTLFGWGVLNTGDENVDDLTQVKVTVSI